MKFVSKVTLCTVLLTGILSGVNAPPAKAAEAHITYLTSTHAYPPQGSPYNIVFYSYGCSWSGAGKLGIASLDWYQPTTWTSIFMYGYNSPSGEVSGSKIDVYRPSGVDNYYKLEVRVIDMALPYIVYADVFRGTWP